MQTPYFNNVRSDIKKMLLLQIGVAMMVSLAFWLFGSVFTGFSALLGGITFVIANAYYSWQFFKVGGASVAREVLHNIFLAETLKIFITVILFILAFKVLRVRMLPFFLNYIAVQMTVWFTPFIFRKRIR